MHVKISSGNWRLFSLCYKIVICLPPLCACTWGLYSRWKLSYAYRSNINLTIHDGNYLSILAELAVTRSLPKTMCHIKRSFDYGTDVVGEYFGKFNFPVGVVWTLIHCRYVAIYENVRLHYDVMPWQRFPHYCPSWWRHQMEIFSA